MALIVMKFGGSSVSSAENRKIVASRIVGRRGANNKVVVVVSAPGDTTDDLLAMAEEISANPSPREMDVLLSTGEMISVSLLAMLLHTMDTNAVSLSGAQAGIVADTDHTRARILKINPKKIKAELNKNNVVIVAGFQGINKYGDTATLGRGGSDLTAVAIAAAINADVCEIYTDVEGIFTTDPRVVKEARKIDKISYDEMLEMASSGAQVMQGRSIEVAKKNDLEIQVRSTFLPNAGTIITSPQKIGRKQMEALLVSAVTFDKNQVKFSIIGIPDMPGVAAKVFVGLSKMGVNVDMIIQSATADKTNDISFTVCRADVKKTQVELTKLAKELKAQDVICDERVAKVSVVGIGMKSNTGVAAKMFELLAKKNINIEMISTSEIKISCMVDESDLTKAVETLHKGFKLDKK
ncbi:MAG: aspartate kinase [Elusimicrobia bacterium]|nr:aspartate kinase [Elusimicrobiota bacterium]